MAEVIERHIALTSLGRRRAVLLAPGFTVEAYEEAAGWPTGREPGALASDLFHLPAMIGLAPLGWGRATMGSSTPAAEKRPDRDTTAEALLDGLPDHLLDARKSVDDLWHALEQACAADEKRYMPRAECQRAGRQAAYELLQAISAAEGELQMAQNLQAHSAMRARKEAADG